MQLKKGSTKPTRTMHFLQYKHDQDLLLVLQYMLVGTNLQVLHLVK